MDRSNLKIKSLSELTKSFTTIYQSMFILGSFIVAGIILGTVLWTVNKDATWANTVWYDILIAISTSILASVIFYWLYSKVAEKAVLHEVAVYATDVASQKFLTFQKWTPLEVYDSGENSNKFLFDYRKALGNSKFLWFKGNSGIRTSFSIAKLSAESHQLTDIKLILLDPGSKNLCRDLAQDVLLKGRHIAADETELIQKTEELIQDVYITLTALFDIRKLVPTQVAFCEDHLFFRSEIFSDGIFITYYMGNLGNKFDPRQYYSCNSLAYDAFTYDFRKNFYNSNVITFSAKMSETEFTNKLTELGSKQNIAELRKLKIDRFGQFEAQTL